MARQQTLRALANQCKDVEFIQTRGHYALVRLPDGLGGEVRLVTRRILEHWQIEDEVEELQQRQEGEDRMNPLAQQYLRDRMLSDGYPCEVRDGLNVALGNDPNLAALYPDYSQREMLSCAEDDHAAALHTLEAEGYDVRMVQLPRQSDGRAGGQVHIARKQRREEEGEN